MKRYSIALFFIILSLSCLGAKGFDIRKIRWGMTIVQVRRLERGTKKAFGKMDTSNLEKNYNKRLGVNYRYLFFRKKAAGHDAIVTYMFSKNKLVKLMVYFHYHRNQELFEKKLFGYLDQKYGPCIKKDGIWENRHRENIRVWSTNTTSIEYYKRSLRYSKLNIRIRGL